MEELGKHQQKAIQPESDQFGPLRVAAYRLWRQIGFCAEKILFSGKAGLDQYIKQLETLNIEKEAREFVRAVKDKSDVLEQYSADVIMSAILALNDSDWSGGLGDETEAGNALPQQIIDYINISGSKASQNLEIGFDFAHLAALRSRK